MSKKNLRPKEMLELRPAFPDVCKWFDRGDATARAEIEARARRLREQGISPCQECPLCPGEGHSTP